MIKKIPTKKINGFDVYAPELIRHSTTFISNAHSKLKVYEKNYFWFSERRHLIYFLIKKYFMRTESYCEIGCGGGYMLADLNTVLPNAKIFGTEIFLSGLKIARKRFPDANYFQSDILNFPYENEFDLIGAYDVIEHIGDDEKAIKSIYDSLKPGGGAIISVPQHMWLWTENDNYSCHKRRYSRRLLIQKCKDAGFEALRTTSYPSFLLPVFILNCLLNRKNAIDEKSVAKQFKIHPILNNIFKLICKLELFFTRIGINFCVGSSLICVVKKNNYEKNTI